MNPTIPIYVWPEMPAMPSSGQPVLIRVATTGARADARRELRLVLRTILAAWSGLPLEDLPLQETTRGPVWKGQLHGESLDVSFSYTANDGWIALQRGGSVGVDAMVAGTFSEMEEVARLFLGPEVVFDLRQGADPALRFALAWTDLEARVKCLKRGLREWCGAEAFAMAGMARMSFHMADGLIVTVATAPSTAIKHLKERRAGDLTTSGSPILYCHIFYESTSPTCSMGTSEVVSGGSNFSFLILYLCHKRAASL